ncbi:hypothetical protein FWH58_00670 [Candidatus Saccharibacteria bacterium]|nr:hypothetical protein [Candidatus Saccharibacteria bacterium]
MVERIKQFGQWILRHQWPVFIITVMIVATTLTSISLWLYQVGGAVKLDLSRPGYEKVRDDVKGSSDNTKPFSPTGTLDNTALIDFRSRYETITTRLDQMNNYDNTVMSDENLGLAIGPTVTEPIE